MILVTGTLVARPDTVDQLLELSLEHVRRSRAEPGCLEHGVHRDAENPRRLVFLETWADRAALDAHFRVAASVAFVETAAGLVAEPPTLEIYDAVAVPVRPPDGQPSRQSID